MTESDKQQTKLIITGPDDENKLNPSVDNGNDKNDKDEVNDTALKMDALSIDTKTANPNPEAVKQEELQPFDYNEIAVNMVQFQVEYHLSKENLSLDNFLLTKLHQDKEYWISVKTIAGLTKIKAITEDLQVVLKAIRKSEVLILTEDESKVKRKDFIPPKPKHHKNMRRTVFIYGLSDNHDEEKIAELCKEHGELRAIVFDDGSKHILDPKTINESDLEDIDREVAVQIMTKKFGPRAIRSNSAQFDNVLSPSQTAAWLSMEQKRVSTDLSLGDIENPKESPSVASLNIPETLRAPTSPVFVHPIHNPNGDPLDFSHLKTCFVIFQSQSQASNFCRSRAKTDDGVRALHQYEYIKYQKRASMNHARGISPLISPSSIGLAVNSPTYSILGSTKHSHHNHKQSPSIQASPAQYKHETYDFNQQMYGYGTYPSPMMQPLPPQQFMGGTAVQETAQQAMEFYLANYAAGTPMLIVPANVADAMAQQFTRQLHSAPHSQQRRKSGNNKNGRRRSSNYNKKNGRNSWNGNNYRRSSGNQTWSHGQQKRNSGNYGSNGRFDFDVRRSSNGGNKRNSYNQKNYNYGGSKTMTHRDMRKSWRNKANSGKGGGQIPPEPSPNYFKTNRAGNIAVESSVPKYVVKKQNNRKHESPSVTPKVATISAPEAMMHNIINRANRASH